LPLFQRRRDSQLLASRRGSEEGLLHPIAFRALHRARHVLIRQFIDNNIKFFNVNRVAQQPDFNPFLVVFLQPA